MKGNSRQPAGIGLYNTAAVVGREANDFKARREALDRLSFF